NLQQVGGLLKAADLQCKTVWPKLDVKDQLRVNLITLQTRLQNLELRYEQGLQALKFAMVSPRNLSWC
ncbi:MAG: hypothetical protein IPO07_28580, partial [Haliscomenobacter sp.]